MIRCLLSFALFMSLTGCGGDSSQKGGNEGPGGGDARAQSAAALIPEIIAAVRAAPAMFPEVSITELEAAAARAKIVMRPRTEANGVETDATNDGRSLIELNSRRWGNIVDHDRKLALIFHELLGLMGLEKNGYAISNRLIGVGSRFTTYTRYSCTDTCKFDITYDRTQNILLVTTTSCSFWNWKQNVEIFTPNESKTVFTGNPANNLKTIVLLDNYRFMFNGEYDRRDLRYICEPE